jgi:hypothetical protein
VAAARGVDVVVDEGWHTRRQDTGVWAKWALAMPRRGTISAVFLGSGAPGPLCGALVRRSLP